MRWTERQRAMLREMGVRLWAPAAVPAPGSIEAPLAVEGRLPVGATARSRVDAGAGDPRGAPSHEGPAAVVASPSGRGARTEVAARADVTGPVVATASHLPGLAPADWLVVAEPLDAADPRQEQLLDNMLRAIGVGLLAPNRERRAVFVPLAASGTPSSSEMPGTSRTSGTPGAGSGPTARPGLAAAIDAVAPRCILAFGRAAAAALLGDDAPIGGLRGRVHTPGGVAVVVTFSLPFLLRHPAEKAKAWADLCLAVAAVAAAAA